VVVVVVPDVHDCDVGGLCLGWLLMVVVTDGGGGYRRA